MSLKEEVQSYLDRLSVAAASFDQILAEIEDERKAPDANQDELDKLQRQVKNDLEEIAFERRWVRDRYL